MHAFYLTAFISTSPPCRAVVCVPSRSGGHRRRHFAAAAADAADAASPPAAYAAAGGDEPPPPPPQLDAQQVKRLAVQYERGNCYGCGVRLQTGAAELPVGYVERERYEVKRRHRQLGQLLCRRCQELSNGAMIPGVADFAQQQQQQGGSSSSSSSSLSGGGSISGSGSGFTDKTLLTPEELRLKLKCACCLRRGGGTLTLC